MNRSKIAKITICLIVFLAGIQLVVCHSLSTVGWEISKLETEAVNLEKENQMLAGQMGKTGSLSQIAVKAEAMGFSKHGQVLHLTPLPVALK